MKSVLHDVQNPHTASRPEAALWAGPCPVTFSGTPAGEKEKLLKTYIFVINLCKYIVKGYLEIICIF